MGPGRQNAVWQEILDGNSCGIQPQGNSGHSLARLHGYRGCSPLVLPSFILHTIPGTKLHDPKVPWYDNDI